MAVLNVTFTIEQNCQEELWSFIDTTPGSDGLNNGYGGSITGKATISIVSGRGDIKLTKYIMIDQKSGTTYDFTTSYLPTLLNKPDEISASEMLSTLTRIEDGYYAVTYEVYGGVLAFNQIVSGIKYAATNSDSIGTTSPSNYIDVDGVKYLQSQTFTWDGVATVTQYGTATLAALLDDYSLNKLFYCNAKKCIREQMIKYRTKCSKDHELLKNINDLDTELMGAIISFEKDELTVVNDSLRDIELICKIMSNKCNC